MRTMVYVEQSQQFSIEDIQIQLAEFHGCEEEVWLFLKLDKKRQEKWKKASKSTPSTPKPNDHNEVKILQVGVKF